MEPHFFSIWLANCVKITMLLTNDIRTDLPTFCVSSAVMWMKRTHPSRPYLNQRDVPGIEVASVRRLAGKFRRSPRSQPRGCSLTERRNFLVHTPPQRCENLRNDALRQLLFAAAEINGESRKACFMGGRKGEVRRMGPENVGYQHQAKPSVRLFCGKEGCEKFAAHLI